MAMNPGHQIFPNYNVFLEKKKKKMGGGGGADILLGPKNLEVKFSIVTKNRVESSHDS